MHPQVKREALSGLSKRALSGLSKRALSGLSKRALSSLSRKALSGFFRFAPMLAVILVMAGCTIAPDGTRPVPPPEERPPQVEAVAAAQASADFLNRAAEARRAGDLVRAQELLIRAQRIAPRNGAVYLELARLHRAKGDTEQARTMAERGLLYCRGEDCARLRAFLNE